jgi:hypothetical protein
LTVSGVIVEPVVGAEINDPLAVLKQLGNQATGCSVRQAAKNAIRPGDDLLRARILALQVDPPGEAGMNRGQTRTSLLTARRQRNLRAGVAQQELDQLQRRVAGCAKNRHACHGHGVDVQGVLPKERHAG